MSVVIDTNVAVVANGKHDAASNNCFSACIDALLAARNDIVLIDDNFLILEEYKNNLSFSGQPGMGDAFFKWLWSNQANTVYCKQVSVTPADCIDRVFEEFPNDVDLKGFDRSDRKFVAVAIASGDVPRILNAADTDWWIFREPLARHGVQVQFLCEDLMVCKKNG